MSTEPRLSALLSEFARTLLTDFPIQQILEHLVGRIVEVLPIGSAGVTLISGSGTLRHVAASDDAALRYVKLQTELGEGPCLTAHRTGRFVSVPDLAAGGCAPEFTRRALDEGLAAVFSFPLRTERHRLGALDLYRDTPGPMEAEATETAQILADVATAYLVNADTRIDLEASSQLAQHNSLHDALTGLPNRALFVQRLDHAMMRARRSEKLVAVLFADLDRFKQVNDVYGHHVGDELLVAVAGRLSGVLRPGDTLARLAGDEFVILCEDLDDMADAEPLASRIETVMSRPFDLSGSEISLSPGVGIAFAGLGEDVPEQVLEEAEAAMYRVKRSGGGRHAVIDLREHRSVNHRARLNRDLRGAQQRDELTVHYQPIVSSASGALIGAEALLRWQHPAFGFVPPAILIPMAEQSRMITEIGTWLLKRACVDGRRWQEQGRLPDFGIYVNVSVRQLMEPDFAATVGTVLDDTGFDPAHLTLELTESVLVTDSERALSVMWALKRLGVNLAVDDFGSGHSSLSRLQQFPVDTVKIDREFLGGPDHEPSGLLVIEAVVRLAHGLGMRTVTEGIETVEQGRAVAQLDSDFSQGFYFSPPQPADTISDMVANLSTLPRLAAPVLNPTAPPAGYRSGLSSRAGPPPARQMATAGTDTGIPLSFWRRQP